MPITTLSPIDWSSEESKGRSGGWRSATSTIKCYVTSWTRLVWTVACLTRRLATPLSRPPFYSRGAFSWRGPSTRRTLPRTSSSGPGEGETRRRLLARTSEPNAACEVSAARKVDRKLWTARFEHVLPGEPAAPCGEFSRQESRGGKEHVSGTLLGAKIPGWSSAPLRSCCSTLLRALMIFNDKFTTPMDKVEGVLCVIYYNIVLCMLSYNVYIYIHIYTHIHIRCASHPDHPVDMAGHPQRARRSNAALWAAWKDDRGVSPKLKLLNNNW